MCEGEEENMSEREGKQGFGDTAERGKAHLRERERLETEQNRLRKQRREDRKLETGIDRGGGRKEEKDGE